MSLVFYHLILYVFIVFAAFAGDKFFILSYITELSVAV